MNNIAIVEKSIHIRKDGQAVTTSKHVADTFGKQHFHVLRDIKELDCSSKYRESNFGETVIDRPNPSGGAPIATPAYEITKNGLMFLVMGYKGAKAARLKEMWIEAFDKMEIIIRIQAENQAYTLEQLAQARETNRKLTARLLADTPYWGNIKHYKDLDLSNNEVGRLIGKSGAFVSKTLKKMKALGIRPASKPMELETTRMLLESQRRITEAYRQTFPGYYGRMVAVSRGGSLRADEGAVPAIE